MPARPEPKNLPKPILTPADQVKTAICYQTPSYNARRFAYIQKSQPPIDAQLMNLDDRIGVNLRRPFEGCVDGYTLSSQPRPQPARPPPCSQQGGGVAVNEARSEDVI